MGKHIGCDVDWQIAPEGTVFYSEGYFRNEKGDWWSEVWGRWCSTPYTVEELTQANDYEPKPEETEMEDTKWTQLLEECGTWRVNWNKAPEGAQFYSQARFRKYTKGVEYFWSDLEDKWFTTEYQPLEYHAECSDFEVNPHRLKCGEYLNDEWDNPNLGRDEEFVKVSDISINTPIKSEWTATHYDNYYQLTPKDIEVGKVKIDAYFVNKMWNLNQKDDTGGLFHSLKTIARFGEKNSIERELKALYNQTKRMAELYGVELE